MGISLRRVILLVILSLTILISCLPFLVSKAYAAVPATYPQRNLYMPDDSINALFYNNGILYIGGSFTHVGYYSAYGVVVNGVTGKHVIENPVLNGQVNVAVSDGNGGWFIGGRFKVVGTETHNRLAHIKSDGTVDSNFTANVDSDVLSMVKNGTTLYIGGSFGTVDGVTRKGVAAVNTSDGSVTNFDPEVYSQFTSWFIYDMALHGNTLYVTGSFDHAGGQARSGIAALDTTLNTNNATSWNPDVNGFGYSLALSSDGNTIYVAGNFDEVNSTTRYGLAQINTSDGTLTSFDASLNSTAIVYSVLLSGSTIYIGGSFTSVGGSGRNNLASVNASTGAATSFNPNLNGRVETLATDGTTLYANGSFTTSGGVDRVGGAAYTMSTGNLTSWDINVDDNGNMGALATDGTNVYVGGTFFFVNLVPRNNIAALDISTGEPTSWAPDPDGEVDTIVVDDNSVYFGGTFTTVAGSSHNSLVSVDKNTGTTVNWDAGADDTVDRLLLDGNALYVAGDFTSIGGQNRNYIAKLSKTTGLVDSWNPDPDSNVLGLAVKDSTLYLGGYFNSISGTTRNYLASYNTTDGSLTSWNPDPDNYIDTFAIAGNKLYVGGFFTTIAGVSRNNLAAFDISGNLPVPTAWNPDPNDEVDKLYADDNIVIVGGYYTSIGGSSQSDLAAIDATSDTNNLLPWVPTLPFTGTTYGIAASPTELFIGGAFESINNLFIWSWRLSEYAYTSVFTSLSPTPTPTTVPGTSGLGSSGGSSTSTSCTGIAPEGQPSIYQIIAGKTSATLFFTPVSGSFDKYVVSYGLDGNANDYTVTFNAAKIGGLYTYTVDSLTPGKTYFFKIRAQNGCVPGVWGNTKNVTVPIHFTNSLTSSLPSDLLSPSAPVTPTSATSATLTPNPTEIQNQSEPSNIANPVTSVSTASHDIVNAVVSGNEIIKKTAAVITNTLPDSIKKPLYLGLATTQDNRVVQWGAKIVQLFTIALLVFVAIPQILTDIITAFPLLADIPFYLIRLFTAIIEFFHIKRKPKPWGIVFDAKNGQPIDPAVVYLSTLPESLHIPDKNRITDIQGRFGFLVNKGLYRLNVEKTDYTFPSKILSGMDKAHGYNNLYFGQNLEVKDADVITVNIPMDPIRKNWNQQVKDRYYTPYRDWIKENTLRDIMIVNIILNLCIYTLFPTVLNLLILISFIVVIVIRMFLKPKKWGVVYEEETRKLLSNVVVRAKRLIGTQEIESGHTTTDERGRYYLLLFEGTGYLQVEQTMADGTIKVLGKTNNFTIKNTSSYSFPTIKV